MGEWFRPDLVELWAGRHLRPPELRQIRPKLPGEPFRPSMRRSPPSPGAVQRPAAPGTVSSLRVESLLRARLHARTGQLLEDRGDRPQA